MNKEEYLPSSRRYEPLRPQKRSCSCGRVLCWTLLVLLSVLLILAVIALILYFYYQPKPPTFDMTNFQMSNFTVTPNNLTAVAANPNAPLAYVNGKALYGIAGANPNKVQINYDYINIAVLFQSKLFANSTIPAFSQEPNSAKTVNGSLVVQQFPLSGEQGTAFIAAFSDGNLPLQVVANTSASITVAGITSPSLKVGLSCNLTVNLASSDVVSKQCSSISLNY